MWLTEKFPSGWGGGGRGPPGSGRPSPPRPLQPPPLPLLGESSQPLQRPPCPLRVQRREGGIARQRPRQQRPRGRAVARGLGCHPCVVEEQPVPRPELQGFACPPKPLRRP